MTTKRLVIALSVVVAAAFAVLGGVGYRMVRRAPPIPSAVEVAAPGAPPRVLFDGESIRDGQNVWQSLGGQQIGSIWGHGAYVAPDWTADWLHRELGQLLDERARSRGAASFAALADDDKAAVEAAVRRELRANTYDAATDRVTITPARAAAFEALAAHYAGLFSAGHEPYAIPAGALTDQARARKMAAFFWWTAWAASTNRPGSTVSYTNNWPHEPLVGNAPPPSAIVWTAISIVLLLAGIGALVWWNAARREEESPAAPRTDPLLGLALTPSQRATLKYFYVVAALVVVQIGLGALTAHYGVEGTRFFGLPLAKILPYAVTRTWHTQIGIFWIATSWLATGLFLAPAIGGREPRWQRAGVDALFAAVVFVVVGSLTGEWFGIQQRLGNLWFWFGAQGYEYVDLGRVWQILLFVGLLGWLALMARALLPALRRADENRALLLLFVASAIAIPMFYGAGLMYGQRSHLVTAEYWRWWVVHLWVEGFFEVFATVVIAFLFTRLGLLAVGTATRSVLFSTVIFLSGGIVGTFHHLYFTGTESEVLALGAVFSALEVVPLCLVGYEALGNLKLVKGEGWIRKYRWPVYFFVGVAFWNFVGAGLFGFLINPPLALYYMQGLNTTPVHGHTALFGVYGLLGMGLMLFSLRAAAPGRVWRERPLRAAFWCMNAGLVLMVVLSMLPIGLAQTWAAVETGTWYARSSEFLQLPVFQTLRWMRGIGDVVFAAGAVTLGWFVIGLRFGWSWADTAPIAAEAEGAADAAA